MIDYQVSKSHFFHSNKAFIEKTIEDLGTYNFSGWVNAYGFDIEGTTNKHSLSYTLFLRKHQTSQNGIYIPMNAHVNSEMELIIDGLKDSGNFSYGVSFLEKLSTLNFNGNTSLLSERLNQFAEKFNARKLVVKNGKLRLKMSNSPHQPAEIIEELSKILST